MSKQIEAMKLALEALVDARVRPAHKQDSGKYEAAITAIREALAEQPAQPLTDEQIDALLLPPSGTATVRDLVRIIEAAHGITKGNT